MIDFIQAIGKHINNEHTDESFARASICSRCEFKEQKFYAEFLNSEIVEINGFVCGLCDCPLATKIFAQDEKNKCEKWKQ